MTDDAALFAAALAHPDQNTPRLVLADWFDDHGEDELASALRTVPGIIPFLSDLARWDRMPATPTWEFTDGQYVARSESQYWAKFLARYPGMFPIPPGMPDGYDPDAGWTTTPPERVGPARFLEAWQDARQRLIAGLREEAAGIATGWRNRPIMLPTGDDPRAVEQRAVLLHELVVRGCGPGAIPGGARAWAELAAARHPLSRLPDRLLEVEAGVRPLLSGTWTPSTQPGLTTRPVAEFYPSVFSDRTPPPESPAWSAARRWAAESNGRLDAREFNLQWPHSDRGEWTGWFRALPFDPLRQDTPTTAVGRQTAGDALLTLFWAARSGGAYGPVAGSAYPRLHAWESLGWLAGADTDASCAAVADLAERCRWYAFEGDWFYHIAWDIGLVCVRPDGHSVAVLAATDTD